MVLVFNSQRGKTTVIAQKRFNVEGSVDFVAKEFEFRSILLHKNFSRYYIRGNDISSAAPLLVLPKFAKKTGFLLPAELFVSKKGNY